MVETKKNKTLENFESEAEIQSQIVQYLIIQEQIGELFFWRSNSFSGEIQRKNGTKGYIKSNKKGLPDISSILKSGKYMGIEIKSKKGTMSKEQKEVAEKLNKLNAIYICVSSLSELIEDLKIIKEKITI